ncbi:unnamed protein product, partial [Anisakis simplex]|uniref:Cadherin domain-containing protein n=1 Tax=Anisakis simplex TaxID=6269 RepID=A0A0M3JF95_ANISI
MFAVKEKTGEIVLRRHLDREHRDRYEFTVEARDHQPDQRTGTGIAQGSGTAQVRVDVTDVNDNAPYFVNASRLYCFLRRSARPGAEIARLVARDADRGPFGRITYQLHQAPVDLGLDLDETSGLLYLGDSPKAADLLRNKREREFQVLIGAKDGGGLAATSNLSIALQLVDDDEEVPRF